MLDSGAPSSLPLPVPHPAATQPDARDWGPQDRIYRRFETQRLIVAVDAVDADDWDRVTDDLLHWRVKTRSGFTVLPGTHEGAEDGTESAASAGTTAVTAGARPIIRAGALGIRVYEPVEVVAVVQTPTRVGFAYRTLPGHPVRGEEAFILQRDTDGISLTIRSLTRPAASGMWRVLFPLLRVAQVVARFRYLRSLR